MGKGVRFVKKVREWYEVVYVFLVVIGVDVWIVEIDSEGIEYYVSVKIFVVM